MNRSVALLLLLVTLCLPWLLVNVVPAQWMGVRCHVLLMSENIPSN